MVKITIMYPNKQGSKFEMSYYLNTHMPLSIECLSADKGYKGFSVEHGMAGDKPDSDPPYVAMCHYLFDSVEDFLAAFMPYAELLQGDIPNYTK